MKIVIESFEELYPGKIFNYVLKVKFSNRLKPYNAIVRKSGAQIDFHLSKMWRGISKDIVKGLYQDLFAKLFDSKIETGNMKLYNNFIKNIHIAAPRVDSPLVLIASFERVNALMLNGLLEQPNLEWGQDSKNRLATYDYHTDTIRISTKFKKAHQEVLDYLMYHEMLHKHFKFDSSKGRTVHHSSAFKKMEKAFPNAGQLEKQLKGNLG